MDGLIVINKHKGVTSQNIVSKVKRILKVKKAGHFGTLDPMAEGVLVVALGKATRFFDFYIKSNKYYTGLIDFGYSTTTYDAEGEQDSEKKEIDLYEVDIETLKSGFFGEITQFPPIYSAKKRDGKPLYKYARENKEVEIKSSQVNVHSFETEIKDKNTLWFRICCSSGTYIRSIAHDLGQKAGTGAYLKKLTRIGSGEFSIENSSTISDLENMSDNQIAESVIPLDQLLTEYPGIVISREAAEKTMDGMEIRSRDILEEIDGAGKDDIFRIVDERGKLLAFSKRDKVLMTYQPYLVLKRGQ